MRSVLLTGVAALLLSAVSLLPPIAEQHHASAADRREEADREQDGGSAASATPDGRPCAACQEIARHIQGGANPKWQQSRAFGWAAVIAAVLYSAIALGQLCAISRQASIASAQLVRMAKLERPWITIELNADRRIGQGGPWPIVAYDIINGGRSPARILLSRIGMQEFEGRPESWGTPPSTQVTEPDIEIVMAPGARRHDARGLPMGSRRYTRLAKGESRAALFGVVMYRDTFSEPDVPSYEFAFCYVFEPFQLYDGVLAEPDEIRGTWIPGGPRSWTNNT